MPEGLTFGEQLRRFRKQKGLSQIQLGNLLGVSDRAVSKWENNLARPKSSLLARLCECLEVTSDELLDVRISAGTSAAGASRPEDSFWHEAYRRLTERYGPLPPLEMLGRFEKEKAAFYGTALPQIFRMFAVLRQEAEESGHGFDVLGGIGSSFLAFLLGATEVNPLPAHYVCPACRTVEWCASARDGWDLPPKQCACCGKPMQRDGHDLPFEAFGCRMAQKICFDVRLDGAFEQTAVKRMAEFSPSFSLTTVENPNILYRKKLSSRAVTVVMAAGHSRREVKTIRSKLTCAQFSAMTAGHPCLNLLFDGSYDDFVTLQHQVRRSGVCVNMTTDRRLDAMLQTVRNAAIPPFIMEEFRALLHTNRPASFSELLQLFGIALLFAEYPSYKSMCQCEKLPVDEMIVYREDAYRLVADRLRRHHGTDPALAYTIVNDIRTGTFFRSGIHEASRAILDSIGFPEEITAQLRRTPYLFPKSTGLIALKRALEMTAWQYWFGVQ